MRKEYKRRKKRYGGVNRAQLTVSAVTATTSAVVVFMALLDRTTLSLGDMVGITITLYFAALGALLLWCDALQRRRRKNLSR